MCSWRFSGFQVYLNSLCYPSASFLISAITRILFCFVCVLLCCVCFMYLFRYRHALFCCATLLSYKMFFFFYKLKISGHPALLKPITVVCSNCMCSFCLSHFGNSHGISNIFIIIVFVMAICVECVFM